MNKKDLIVELKILHAQQKYEMEERKKLEDMNKKLNEDISVFLNEKIQIQSKYEELNHNLEQEKALLKKQLDQIATLNLNTQKSLTEEM